MSLLQRKKESGSAKNFFAACILFYLNNLYFATVKDELYCFVAATLVYAAFASIIYFF